MSEENKPDGYVAWHPKFKIMQANTRPHEIVYQSEDAAWYALQVFRMWTCKTREQLTEDNWRVRPVKLVFLDEPPKQIKDLSHEICFTDEEL